MKTLRIIEEMTRLQFPGCCYKSKREVYALNPTQGHVYPSFYAGKYLIDHNAVQRVLDGMDDDTADMYMLKLEAVVCNGNCWINSIRSNSLIVKATCAQKCEAIMNVYGKWEEE